VTERTRSNEQFRRALEAVPTGMLMTDPHGRIVLVNAMVEAMFGYTREELLGEPVETLVPDRFRGPHPSHMAAFLDNPQTRRMGAGRDLYGRHKDGGEIPIEIGLSLLHTPEGDFVLSSVVDITERRRPMEQLPLAIEAERRQAEQEREGLVAELGVLNADLEERVRARTAQLTTALKERDVLLQEVRHRVKNNLQVISSLINLQIRKLVDRASRSGLEECRARVEAIALIHEKLYKSSDYARVPFSDYAKSLAGNIFHATGVSPANITLGVDVESISLPVDKAIPCGLILNELITNALKHAFPDGRNGSVRVELSKTSGGEVQLAVSDDGIGLTCDIDPRTSSTLGMQLVSTLVQQLDGELDVIRRDGMAFRITFPLDGNRRAAIEGS
jgi:PAS domain S-box-containing protein